MTKEILRLEDMNPEELVGSKVAADYLNCSRQTIKNWVNGVGVKYGMRLPLAGRTPGGRFQFRVIDLIKYRIAMIERGMNNECFKLYRKF